MATWCMLARADVRSRDAAGVTETVGLEHLSDLVLLVLRFQLLFS